MLLLISYIGSMATGAAPFYCIGTIWCQIQARNPMRDRQDAANIQTEIKNAVRLMHGLKQPVALLFTGEFTI
jgi:hypothetical protein